MAFYLPVLIHVNTVMLCAKALAELGLNLYFVWKKYKFKIIKKLKKLLHKLQSYHWKFNPGLKSKEKIASIYKICMCH